MCNSLTDSPPRKVSSPRRSVKWASDQRPEARSDPANAVVAAEQIHLKLSPAMSPRVRNLHDHPFTGGTFIRFRVLSRLISEETVKFLLCLLQVRREARVRLHRLQRQWKAHTHRKQLN